MREFFEDENEEGYRCELVDRLGFDHQVVAGDVVRRDASAADVGLWERVRWILDGISPERDQLVDPDADDPEDEDEDEE